MGRRSPNCLALSQWEATDSVCTALPTSDFLFSIKSTLLPLPCGDLQVAHHIFRSQIAILCWPQINPSLLEEFLTVDLSQSTAWDTCLQPWAASSTNARLQTGGQTSLTLPWVLAAGTSQATCKEAWSKQSASHTAEKWACGEANVLGFIRQSHQKGKQYFKKIQKSHQRRLLNLWQDTKKRV